MPVPPSGQGRSGEGKGPVAGAVRMKRAASSAMGRPTRTTTARTPLTKRGSENGSRALAERRERQDDVVHEDVDARPEGEAVAHGLPQQGGDLQAREGVGGGRPEGDHEVQEEAEGGRGRAARIGTRPQEPAGDGLQDPHRAHIAQGIDHEGIRDVEHPRHQAPPQDRWHRARRARGGRGSVPERSWRTAFSRPLGAFSTAQSRPSPQGPKTDCARRAPGTPSAA